MFRTLAYLEPEASSKGCRTCQMIMHVQSPNIEQFIQTFSRIFRHIQGYLGIFSHTHRRATKGERGDLFENRKKCPDFGKKGPDCDHLWVKFSIQNIVLRVSRRKNSKMFPCIFRY